MGRKQAWRLRTGPYGAVGLSLTAAQHPPPPLPALDRRPRQVHSRRTTHRQRRNPCKDRTETFAQLQRKDCTEITQEPAQRPAQQPKAISRRFNPGPAPTPTTTFPSTPVPLPRARRPAGPARQRHRLRPGPERPGSRAFAGRADGEWVGGREAPSLPTSPPRPLSLDAAAGLESGLWREEDVGKRCELDFEPDQVLLDLLRPLRARGRTHARTHAQKRTSQDSAQRGGVYRALSFVCARLIVRRRRRRRRPAAAAPPPHRRRHHHHRAGRPCRNK